MKIGLWSAGPMAFSCNPEKKTRERETSDFLQTEQPM